MPRKPKDPSDTRTRFQKMMGRYKTYDPSTEGYGSVGEWQQAWDQKMGVEQARTVLGANDPLTILGFTKMPNKAELKRRYYKLVMENQGAMRFEATQEEKDKLQGVIAAYSVLEDRAR